jgi:Fic family protein
MSITIDTLTGKKTLLDAHRPLPPELVKNLDEWFRVELTYTSNAIEGNTLTRQETALVVEKGLTVGGKSLKEHLEAINHVAALDFIKTLIKKKPQNITQNNVLEIHHLILKGIDEDNAGRYRSVTVRIAGSQTILPNAAKVSQLMTDLFTELSKSTEHPVKIAADAHYKLVSIHPFIDGNGRTARLLMNLILMQSGYPPAIIRKEDRLEYLKALEKGQTTDDLKDYYNFIYEAVDRSLDIYLDSL